MAIVISGNGIDMGGNPVSNVDVGASDSNAATVDYVKNNGDVSAVTGFSQIFGVNEIVGEELTNNIHDIFGDGSCVATYQLNGNANDLGGNYNGTATNTTYEEGKFGQAAVFDSSTSQKITAPNYLVGDWNTGSKSVSLWVKTTNTTKTLTLFCETTNAYNRGYGILTYNNGLLVLGYHQTQGANSNQTQHRTNINISDGYWHHITVTGNDSGIQIFVDNVSLNVTKITGASSSNGNTDYKFKIGSWELNTTAYKFEGSIDQVRIFNRALTESEINTLYTESRVSADAQLNINQGTFIYPKGLGERGYKKSSDVFTGTVDVSAQTNGWKYVAKDENNNFSFYDTKPTLGKTTAELYLKDGKLYNSSDDTEITPVSFLSNKVRIASGIPLELAPTGIAKSVTESLEAKEVLGKNQCTAWVNFDGTTTPPTIKDSYNVSSVVRNSTGFYDIYFKTQMDNVNYVWAGKPKKISGQNNTIAGADNLELLANKLQVYSMNSGNLVDNSAIKIVVFGGKN